MTQHWVQVWKRVYINSKDLKMKTNFETGGQIEMFWSERARLWFPPAHRAIGHVAFWGRRFFYGSLDWPPVLCRCARGQHRSVWLAVAAEHFSVDLQAGVAGLHVQDLTEALGLFLQSADRLRTDKEEWIKHFIKKHILISSMKRVYVPVCCVTFITWMACFTISGAAADKSVMVFSEETTFRIRIYC